MRHKEESNRFAHGSEAVEFLARPATPSAGPILLRNSCKTVAISSAPPEGLASSFLGWWRVFAPFALLRSLNGLIRVVSQVLQRIFHSLAALEDWSK
jgi:hypothetical protein